MSIFCLEKCSERVEYTVKKTHSSKKIPIFCNVDCWSGNWKKDTDHNLLSCEFFRQRLSGFYFTESQTIEEFGDRLELDRSDLEHLRSVFMAVENGDIGMLKSLGIKDSELGDVKFFLEKLINTGFLD